VRNPASIPPWQHVLECLSGYLLAAARLSQEGKASRLASGGFSTSVRNRPRDCRCGACGEILKVWPGE